MAGRNHIPASALKLREVPLAGRATHPALIDDPRVLHRVPPLPASVAAAGRPHPALIEERIASQHREIQSLLLDNQRLAASHVALKQDLSAAQQELRHLSATAASVKAEKDAQVREVYERSLKMEAELRSVDGLNAELAEVRADVEKLSADKKELTAKLQAIDDDLVRSRAKLRHFPAIETEIETMRQEIQKGRAAIEYEKKTRASNLEQEQAMEKNMISMAREIEKLHAELANADKRARAAVAAAAAATPSPGYGADYRNAEMEYNGSLLSDPYAIRQVQTGGDAGSQFGQYDMQRAHVHR